MIFGYFGWVFLAPGLFENLALVSARGGLPLDVKDCMKVDGETHLGVKKSNRRATFMASNVKINFLRIRFTKRKETT